MIKLYNEDFQDCKKLLEDYKVTLEEHLESPHRWLKKAALEELKKVNFMLTRLKDRYNQSVVELEITNGR